MNKLIGVGVSTFVVGALAGKLLFPKKQESSQNEHKITQKRDEKQQINSQETKIQAKVALLGDIGGTNIRLQLVLIQPPHNQPQKIIKKVDYLVDNQPTLQGALCKFLLNLLPEDYPQVAAIAIAGPVSDNKLTMANVRKWGVIDGDLMGKNLNIPVFKLLNDFQANSYGLLIVPDKDFISLNGHKLNKDKAVGILGPGTGLGNSILFTTPFRHRKRVYVLGSQGGHSDVPYIDDQVLQYIQFFQLNLGIPDIKYISLQRSFCGPAIPMMYRFYQNKFPEDQNKLSKQVLENKQIVSKEIMKKCLQQGSGVIYQNVFKLFMKIYQAAIGNFMAHHMCVGGMVLVGGLTNGILTKLKERNLLEEWKKRHVQFYKNIQNIPIIVCKEIDLGLKGAFVMARRVIADQQHD